MTRPCHFQMEYETKMNKREEINDEVISLQKYRTKELYRTRFLHIKYIYMYTYINPKKPMQDTVR